MGGRYRTWLNAKSVPRPELAGDNKRLNILWISCEDISPNLGCYGDEYASTPNLDRLAEQGMRFSQAFTPAGVCAVVRSGIITGMYPISIGSQHMRSRIVTPDGVRCFSEYLREAGYFCT
ncbi:MAG TPA: sulfatase, partial [Planctomycetaceae bacterium]|nr:sulfatase [Planctomycetaceae bacterium]